MREAEGPERDAEPKTQEQGKPLTRIQKWTRAAVVGLLLPLAASTAATAYFERSHHPVAPISASDPKADTIPGTLYEERILNPELTEDGYLDLLASHLTTPQLLDRFFLEHFEYTSDTTNHPTIFPRMGEKHDYWQTPTETVQRVRSITRKTSLEKQYASVMVGDCEDLAFLVQEILWRQGKIAHVVNAFDKETGHTACIWTEERPDGRYDGYSILDEGVMRNGSLGSLGMSDDGFDTPSDAFFSAAAIYTDHANSIHPAFIPTSRIRGPFRYTDIVTIQAFNHNLPHLPSYLDFLATMGISASGYAAYRFFKQRGQRETWKEYFTKFRLV